MFQKGQIANPTGKSKIQAEFEKKCREYMDSSGWKAVEELANSNDKKAKMWALEKIMDRGFGRPKESHDITTRLEPVHSPTELAANINEFISRQSINGLGLPGRSEAST